VHRSHQANVAGTPIAVFPSVRCPWKIRTSGSSYRLYFDIHRAFGLWTWVLLLVIAFTGFSLNRYFELFAPLMKKVSSYTPTPYELRRPAPPNAPIEPKLSFADIVAKAEADGRSRGWTAPVGATSYARQYGIYATRFFKPSDDESAGGISPRQLYYDGQDGRLLGAWQPWVGTAADIFVQAQFPVHSGSHPRPTRSNSHIVDGANCRGTFSNGGRDLVPQTARPTANETLGNDTWNCVQIGLVELPRSRNHHAEREAAFAISIAGSSFACWAQSASITSAR
jgi:hypothetical protein